MTEATTPAAGEKVFGLTYRSRSKIPVADRKSVLGSLFTQARRNNKAALITGALLATDEWFVQTLEGEETAVRSLYARIERDPRHDSFSVLVAEPDRPRVFGRWSMAEVAESTGEPDTFLIAHKDGISPAASLRPNGQQESILRMMRSAARGDEFASAGDGSDPISDQNHRTGIRTGPLAM